MGTWLLRNLYKMNNMNNLIDLMLSFKRYCFYNVIFLILTFNSTFYGGKKELNHNIN